MQRIADNYGEWVGTCQSYIQRRNALSARLGEFGTVQVRPSTLPSFSALLRKLRLEGIVRKRLDTALGKDAVAEAQPIRDR